MAKEVKRKVGRPPGRRGKARAATGKISGQTGTGLLKFEIIGLLLIFFGIFSALGSAGIDTGSMGYAIDGVLAYGFGFSRIVISLALIIVGLKYIMLRRGWPLNKNWGIRFWLYIIFLSLVHLALIPAGAECMPDSMRVGGGVFGAVVASALRALVGNVCAFIVLIIAGVATLILWKRWSISRPVTAVSEKAGVKMDRLSDKAVDSIQGATRSFQEWQETRNHFFDMQKDKGILPPGRRKEEAQEEALPLSSDPAAAAVPEVEEQEYPEERVTESPEPAAESEEKMPVCASAAAKEAAPIDVETPAVDVPTATIEAMADLKPVEVEPTTTAADIGTEGCGAVPKAPGQQSYRLPSLSMLKKGTQQSGGVSDEVRHNAAILQDTLRSFNIDAKMLNASQGPAVTRFELEPAAGVKVSKIVHLADDIALKLAATDIRIEAPIPGKAAVGIEVPNTCVAPVTLRDVLESDSFRLAKGGVPVGLGKDIAGNPIVADLTKMPHLLVAGSTGSGKSVCINTFIASILFKQRPEDVKLILVDPKVVELSNYNGIPHLMTPVVTDPKKAASVLRWAVREMDDRYKRFAVTRTRDISRFNELHPEEAMPFVVIIIDELADLMMAASGDVEESICRLAQKARACGMHLVLATQRPSVDVLTGLIKANIPSRIAFAVSSQIDSRTILDMAGAEKLIGKGDMLFYPMGASKPLRVQGAFIGDGEIDALTEWIKEQGKPQYDQAVQQAQEEDSSEEGAFFEDELMGQAVDMVLETGQASASMLQRRFRIGYTRAARLIDTMEAMKIVGPNHGSKPREILMTAEEVQKKFFSAPV